MAYARAVAVRLSGLDGDGRAALTASMDGGGATFAQSDAAFDSVPRALVETGASTISWRHPRSPRP